MRTRAVINTQIPTNEELKRTEEPSASIFTPPHQRDSLHYQTLPEEGTAQIAESLAP